MKTLLRVRFLFLLPALSIAALLGACHDRISGKDPSAYFLMKDTVSNQPSSKAWRLFKEGRFERQSTHSFNPGFTNAYYWLVVVNDTATAQPLQLEIGTAQINDIGFYAIVNGEPVKQYTTGDYNVYASRPEPSLNFNFPLSPDIRHYLLKIDKKNEALQLTFTTHPARFFQSEIIESHLVIGVFTGIITLMLIFGLYLFIITRERVYLLYILYVTGGWLYVLANLGYGYKYLWPDSPFFTDRSRPVFSLLTIGLSIYFLEVYAGKAAYRWLQKLMRALANVSYFLAALALIPGAALRSSIAGYYFQALIPVLASLYIVSIFVTLTQKVLNRNKMAAFYLFSITPIVFFSTLQVFYYSGGLDFSGSFLQHYGQATGYVLEAIILTFGLAYRFNSYRIEKEQLLIRVNQQQVKYTKAIINTQQNERRQLADQLHDVAGSLLSAAKLNLSSVREKNFITHADARTKLNQAEEAVTTISEMLRNMSHAISPVMLDKVGFRQAVEKVAAIFNTSGKLSVELNVLGFEEDQPGMHAKYTVLYGILYELVNNIIKHAQATHALIQLIEHDDSVVLIVEDNGKGLDEQAAKISVTHGLSAIQSKIHYLDGTIMFDRAVPKGLIVTIELPKSNDDKNYTG